MEALCEIQHFLLAHKLVPSFPSTFSLLLTDCRRRRRRRKVYSKLTQ